MQIMPPTWPVAWLRVTFLLYAHQYHACPARVLPVA